MIVQSERQSVFDKHNLFIQVWELISLMKITGCHTSWNLMICCHSLTIIQKMVMVSFPVLESDNLLIITCALKGINRLFCPAKRSILIQVQYACVGSAAFNIAILASC